MTDINVRSDNVDVEQIMRQIRARIREKRGVDYTEEEIRELAAVKLEKFLDPRGVRSDLLEQSRRTKSSLPPPPSFTFEDTTIYDSHRAPILRWIRNLLKPIVKLFFNPNPIIQALHIQAELNKRHAHREELDALNYEVMHNLVLELTRLGIEVKNLKMRVESLTSRLEFNERRARSLESVVVYKSPEEQAAPPAPRKMAPEPGGPRPEPSLPAEAGPAAEAGEGPGQRSRRRRRRRGRRGSGPAASIMGGQQVPATSGRDAEAAREASA